MTNIWVVPIEKHEQRYTKQWYTDIPKILATEISKRGLSGWKIRTIAGQEVEDKTTAGAFLNFAATNYYKGTQVASISQLFMKGEIKPGDKFLVTDFWNFAITAIRYMSELLDIPVEIHSIVHAGHYDPSDILGMKMSKEWPPEQERAWFYACDYNYFGSEFHRKMFLKNLKIPAAYHHKAIRSGQPYTLVAEDCNLFYSNKNRIDNIVFTHRLNADKQPEIFKDLVQYLPDEWSYLITQEENLSKAEYYELLAQSKIAFSCSLHENLGVGQMEGTLAGCVPVVPTRASYNEIYLDEFKYPSKWTENWDSYLKHRDQLVNFLINIMNNYERYYNNELKRQVQIIKSDFMNPQVMINQILT